MANKKKEVRRKFREDVFKRDKYVCAWCGKKNNGNNMDAHHITDRNEMPNGGYVKENGISLCKEGGNGFMDSCHMKAEKFHISGGQEWTEGMHPEELYELIGSSYEEAVEKSEKLL